jgi:hypothetical protein
VSADAVELNDPIDAVTWYRHGVDSVTGIVQLASATTTQPFPVGTDETV